MAAFAPPVRRVDFLYSSILYADVGNGNHHPRASVAELAALLRPETRSKDVKPTKDAKDPVGHWYTAQLVHYGLPPTKDKNAAKVRLLNALNSIKLEVPSWILRLESDLRNEWDDANRKAKRQSAGKGNGTTKTSPKKTTAAKRLPSQNTSQTTNVTVNLSLPYGFSMLDRLGIQKSSIGDGGPSPKEQPQVKRKRDPADNPPTSIPQTPVKKQRIKKEPNLPPSSASSPSKRKVQVKQESSPLSQTPARYGSAFVKQEGQGPRIKDEYQDDTIKQEKKRSPKGPGTIMLSGTYKITCPAATSAFPSLKPGSLRLDLVRDEARDVWWATFSWAAWRCVILMNPGPSFETLGEPCTLGWRLADSQYDQLKFGKGCTGEMTFYRDQTIRGTLFNVPGVGALEFWGPRMKGKGVPGPPDAMRDEWDDFVNQAYGR